MSEGHAAAHTLLHTDVSKVTVPLATGLRDQLIGAEKPEEALLEVLGATYATAVELYAETGAGNSTLWDLEVDGWYCCRTGLIIRWEKAKRGLIGKSMPHRGHDGVPCGRKDVGAVVTLIVTFQLPAEILSG